MLMVTNTGASRTGYEMGVVISDPAQPGVLLPRLAETLATRASLRALT